MSEATLIIAQKTVAAKAMDTGLYDVETGKLVKAKKVEGRIQIKVSAEAAKRFLSSFQRGFFELWEPSELKVPYRKSFGLREAKFISVKPEVKTEVSSPYDDEKEFPNARLAEIAKSVGIKLESNLSRKGVIALIEEALKE